ncbi:ABC transporter substrate-binding protein [Roseivivax halodurans]|uniref:ABC transporter substrate-binding protein n=1 Tax=Roseivivax halodurans TaxID=93683 RepID=UPI001FCB9A51|nr:ABC transporter substrate-binding protein [Roseivivax halodurans]
MPRSDLFAAALLASLAGGAPAAPERVVSLNVCTDQLAWLLAPDTLIAVSQLADDPRISAYAGEMAEVPQTAGSAEEIVLIEPDLVLAGTFTTRATVQMLERLGYRVERFAPITSLDEATRNMARMSEVLGREEEAAEMIRKFEKRRAALETGGTGKRALLYHAQGRTSGTGTLTADLLRAAGLANVAEEVDLPAGGRLSLEEAVMTDPDLILVAEPYEGFAWATELTRHPALEATGALTELGGGADWTCETPRLLDAVNALKEASE